MSKQAYSNLTNISLTLIWCWDIVLDVHLEMSFWEKMD